MHRTACNHAALILIACALLLAVVPSAGAAGPSPIVDPVADTPTGVPSDLQGRLGEMPSAGAVAANRGATAANDRKGLGLPAYKALIGRDWKRTMRKADRAFAANLDRSEAVPAGRIAERRDAVGDFDRMFKVADAVKGKGGKQTRKLRVAATLDGGCPHLIDGSTAFGWSGSGRATYEVTTRERAGRFDVVTAVILDGHFRSRPTMLKSAAADDFHSNDFGEISITRNQVAVNRKTGKRSKIGETERFTSTLSPFYKPEGSFEAFIEAQDDGAPAPRRPLRSPVWERMAINFMVIPYSAMRSRVLDAEQLAQTPNRCVRAPVESPSHLAPGATLSLKGVPQLMEDPGINPFYVLQAASKIRAYWINPQGQTARPLGTIERIMGGKPWYEFTAPPAAWPDSKPAGLEFELLSAAGIATTPVSFKAENPSLHFRVLGASLDTSTVADGSHPACGEVGGTRSYTGIFHPTGFDPQNRLEVGLGGSVSGKVSGKVDALWHDQTVFGCQIGEEEIEPCEKAMPDDSPGADGTDDVWVAFRSAPDPQEVKLVWAIHDPHVGYFDSSSDECFSYVMGQLDEATGTRTIARSVLQSREPIDLAIDGSVHLDSHAGGLLPANIDYDFDYRLTIERVAPDGSSLP